MVKLLEYKFLRVVIYPGMGGKITSLFHKERMFEAAAQPGGAKKELRGRALHGMLTVWMMRFQILTRKIL